MGGTTWCRARPRQLETPRQLSTRGYGPPCVVRRRVPRGTAGPDAALDPPPPRAQRKATLSRRPLESYGGSISFPMFLGRVLSRAHWWGDCGIGTVFSRFPPGLETFLHLFLEHPSSLPFSPDLSPSSSFKAPDSDRGWMVLEKMFRIHLDRCWMAISRCVVGWNPLAQVLFGWVNL